LIDETFSRCCRNAIDLATYEELKNENE
jgi:hypothetical protein